MLDSAVSSSPASVLGQPWFLSVVSGLLAVLVYRIAVRPGGGGSSRQRGAAAEAGAVHQSWLQTMPSTRSYLGVFVTVAILVYGSFLVSFAYSGCKPVGEDVPIQTGGMAPF